MRSLSREAKFQKRVKVVELRHAGRSYVQIAQQLGLSRTGVFDICKRHRAIGLDALRDAPSRRVPGVGRTLTPDQEVLIRRLIVDTTPDELALHDALWTHASVSQLIERRLGIALPVRTLGSYLARWGLMPHRQMRLADSGSASMNRWLADEYPVVAARSRKQGGEINWGGRRLLLAEDACVPRVVTTERTTSSRTPDRRPGPSMMSSVNNRGQLRWISFDGALDAVHLIDFLQRLITGSSKKVFLIMADCRVRDQELVELWLAEHEDAIETFHLPDAVEPLPDSSSGLPLRS